MCSIHKAKTSVESAWLLELWPWECPLHSDIPKNTKRANWDEQGANICFACLLCLGWKALTLLPGNIGSSTCNWISGGRKQIPCDWVLWQKQLWCPSGRARLLLSPATPHLHPTPPRQETLFSLAQIIPFLARSSQLQRINIWIVFAG